MSRTNHGTLSLADLAANELESYGIARNGRVAVEGPPILLRPQAAISLGMALHELRTNAADHGALSVPGGRVGVRWHVEHQGEVDARLVVTWQESGGPEVDPAAIKGYGSELIEAGLQAEIGATAKLNFTPAGIAAELVLPLSDGLAQPPVDVKPAEPPKFVANK